MADRQEILVVKKMIEQDYADKHICMVTKLNQPYVSKVRRGKLQAGTRLKADEEFELTEEQKKRLNSLNLLLHIPEIFTSGTSEQDMIYMHVLRFFLVDKEKIYNLYFHLTRSQVNRYMRKKDVDIRKFDSELVGLNYNDYLDLIIDYFM